MPTLEQQIEALDDTTAARLLRVFARANSATEQGLALTADLKVRTREVRGRHAFNGRADQ